MASPKTIAFNKGVEERAEKVRAEVSARYAETHPSKPRTSIRWRIFRSKGVPYANCKVIDTEPAKPGVPALLVLSHPTNGKIHRKPATPALIDLFFPVLPHQMKMHMLGY